MPLKLQALETALAPMQDVTDLPFLRLIGDYGAPDVLYTEFLRVHSQSRPERHIVESIEAHGTGRPIIAQLIGEDIGHLCRTVRELEALPIAGIDLNLGCPAPKVYKKNVGGGLLREPERIRAILTALREAVGDGQLSVKTRLGFEDTAGFAQLLDVFAGCGIDLLAVHGRTVKQLYRGGVDVEQIALARRVMPCPVLANGDIGSVAQASAALERTGCAGVMLGRAAIRNPWIFRQWRQFRAGRTPFRPTLAEVRHYIERLWEAYYGRSPTDTRRVARMKKFLTYIGPAVDAGGAYLHAVRRAMTPRELFALSDAHLIEGGRSSLPYADLPYPGVIARPNHEQRALRQREDTAATCAPAAAG